MKPLIVLVIAALGCGDDDVSVDASAGDAERDAEREFDAPDSGPLVSTVTIEQGVVVGEEVEAGILRFLQIPYAAPPLGELRFRPPNAPGSWAEPRDATSFGPVCPQRARMSEDVVGDEDCLHLNVWAPSEPGPHPVMVWIHGGAFIQGSATLTLYDGAPFVRSGPVVFVSINYRLGLLGFLASDGLVDEAGTAGNYGMLDQVAALEWVQRNVARFGGDPNNVTVFGESAGGASGCALTAMPAADELFDRLIVQSGGGCVVNALEERLPDGRAMVTAAGCEDEDGNQEVACLRAATVEDLVSAQFMGGTSGLGLPSIGPNRDTVHLPFNPIDRIAGDAPAREVIAGSNADEADTFVEAVPVPTEAAFEELVRNSVGPLVADDVIALYPVDSFDSPKAAYEHVFSDIAFICPALSFASAVEASGQQAFTYHYTHLLDGVAARIGAPHGAELFALFDGWAEIPRYAPVDADLALGEAMRAAWIAFARAGAPNTEWSAYPNIRVLETESRNTDTIRDGRCEALRELGVVR